MPMTITSEDELSLQTAVSGVFKGTFTATTTTPSQIISIPTLSNRVYNVLINVNSFRTDVTGASWMRIAWASFYNNAGTLAQVGSTSNISTSGAGAASAFSVSGTNIIFSVNPTAGSQTWNFTAYASYYRGE